MIELRNVTKSYRLPEGGRHYVLRDVSLVIPSGTSVGLLGRNGAGKTTLLKLIGGVDLPDRGTIQTNQAISPVFGLRGAFSGQLSGRTNVRFVGRIQGLSGDALRECERYVAEFSELAEYFDMPLRTYSPGMRARLAFALSMAFDYDYYLIDELIAVGDRTFRKKARAAFAEKRAQAGIILVSHNLKLHRSECDAGVLVESGQAQYFPDIEDAIASYLSLSEEEPGEAAAEFADQTGDGAGRERFHE